MGKIPLKLMILYRELVEYTPEVLYFRITASISSVRTVLCTICSRAYHCSMRAAGKYLLKVSLITWPSQIEAAV